MTIVWFIVWLIANNVGGHEPLLFNPVNAWTATLILAIGLDLGATLTLAGRRRAARQRPRERKYSSAWVTAAPGLGGPLRCGCCLVESSGRGAGAQLRSRE